MNNIRVEQTKSEVLHAAKQMIRTGLVAAVWGNVSARTPCTDVVVITPSGVEYETLTKEMLCIIDLNTGEMIDGTYKPSSETPLHLAVYRARDDVFGVMHTHSTYASAFSCARQEIPPLIEDLAQVCGGPVAVADYALPGTDEVGHNVVEALGTKGAVLMANHGVVGVGKTVSEALRVCQIVEKGAQICAISKSIGEPVLLSDADVTWLREKYTTVYGQQKTK